MKQRGFAPILIIVLIALLATGTYFLGTRNILKLPTFLPLSILSPSPTPTPDPTATWKTYINKDNQFSFMYPEKLEVSQVSDGTILLKDPLNSSPMTIYFNIVKKFPVAPRENLENQIIFTDEQKRVWQTNQILSGNQFIFTGKLESKEGLVTLIIKSIEYNGGELIIEAILAKKHTRLSQQILSTFKFLETTSSTTPTPPAGWVPHEFDEVGVTLYTPVDWKSDITYYPSTNSNLIRFWKKQSPNIVPIQLDIKPDWSNTGDTQHYARNYKVSGSIEAIRIDPPKKEEQVLERYQTNVFFEKSGRVYVFECVHNWTTDYLDTCNKMLETMVFE